MKPADREEILNIYDENHNYLGKEKRSVVSQNHLFHDEIGLWIIDVENGKVLLQKRSANKLFNPNKWGIVAGHVTADETIEQAVINEAKEEIGIDLGEYTLHKLFTIKRPAPRNYWTHYYYILASIPIEKFVIQKEELSQVKYFDYEQLKADLQHGSSDYTFSWDDIFKKVFNALDKVIYGKNKTV